MGLCVAGLGVLAGYKEHCRKDELKSMYCECWQALLATLMLLCIAVNQLLIELPQGEGSVFLGIAAPITAAISLTAAIKLFKEITKLKERC
jgi:hypothetical protein